MVVRPRANKRWRAAIDAANGFAVRVAAKGIQALAYFLRARLSSRAGRKSKEALWASGFSPSRSLLHSS
jgi:hypothetical protein